MLTENVKKLLIIYFICTNILFIGVTPAAYAQVSTMTGIISDQTLILIVRINGKSVNVQHSVLKPIDFYAKTNERNSYLFTVLNNEDEVLYAGDFPNPLQRMVDDFSDPNNPKGGKEILQENTFMLKIPYFASATQFRCELKNTNGEMFSLGSTRLPKPKKDRSLKE